MRSLWITLAGAGAAAIAVALAPQFVSPPPRAAPAAAAPTPIVEVGTPELRRLADTAEFLGRIEAFQKVQVRARVTGMIDEVPFREGDLVREGDVLFRIDPRPYQATLDQAEASLRQK